jgi:hypothetical protein
MDNQNTTNQSVDSQVSTVDPAQKVAERLKQSSSVLVTVSANPSVDQLAACIALTILLNKTGKHATAVFSGKVPSTIEFLQPEKTLEKNTDSLRDFIIALDKSKADRLRYKVEDRYVKIFITPYKTSISEKDLEFSQGDLNCDVIVALGVHHQQDLDQAIMAHGRILHDATIISINTSSQQNNIGNMNWQDDSASSLSELVTNLASALSDKDLLDSQIATALLTGIVASTKRFSNERTAPKTMNASAKLLAAGANQQLVAAKLEPPLPPPQPLSTPALTLSPSVASPSPSPVKPTLSPIPEKDKPSESPKIPFSGFKSNTEMTDAERLEEISIDNQGTLYKLTDENGKPLQDNGSTKAVGQSAEPIQQSSPNDSIAYEPLKSEPNSMTLPQVVASEPSPSILSASTPSILSAPINKNVPTDESETLEQIEKDVSSPHQKSDEASSSTPPLTIDDDDNTLPDIDAVRNVVMSEAESNKPPVAFGSQPLGDDLRGPDAPSYAQPPPSSDYTSSNLSQTPALNMPLPPNLISPSNGPGLPPTSTSIDPTAPPPVPPPIIPPLSAL